MGGAVPDFAAVSVAYGKARCPDVFNKKEKKKKKKKAAASTPPPSAPAGKKKKKKKAKKTAPQLEFSATDLDTLEAIRDPDAVEHLWGEVDPEGAGAADVDAIIESVASFYPDLVNEHDFAVDRSIEHSAQADPDRNTMTTDEFGAFLMNLFGFGKVLDTIGATSDVKLSLKKFKAALKALNIPVSANEQGQVFDAMPSNDGGKIDADDVCLWYVEYLSTAECVPEGSSVAAAAGGEIPKYSTEAFDELESEIMAIAKDPAKMRELWDVMDFNDNQIISLAEIDKLMVQDYPLLNHKPALMRAYKQTCLKEGGDGDAWVEPDEFPQLLLNLFYFNKLFQCFEQVDTDDDRRMDEKEFMQGIDDLGMSLSDDEAKASFDEMDSNDGGIVLFDEFCIWYTKLVAPEREIVDSTSQFVDEVRGGKKKKKKKKKNKGPKDAMPDYSSEDFDELEAKIIAIAKDPVELAKLWDVMDFNDNQIVSLAEIDKLMVQDYPLLNHKPALMRAYKQTCLKEGGDGDAWVEPGEFPQLLLNLFYFNKLFQCFEQVDDDNDRRLDEGEFIDGLDKLGMNLPEDEAKDAFAEMDANGGGIVLFDEFCIWYTKKVSPEREIVDSTSQFVESRSK